MLAFMQSTRSRVLAVSGLLVAASFAAVVAGAASPAAAPSAAKRVQPAGDYGKLPLSFEANRGQADKRVKFLSRGNGYSLFLTDSAAVLALSKGDAAAGQGTAAGKTPRLSAKSVKTDVIRMELAGAGGSMQISATEQLPGMANYFIGNDPSQWHSGVPTYARVRYTDVYPGVDLVYYGNQRQLEYDFVVAPGADPRPIRLRFAGAEALRLDANGDLAVVAANGEIAFHKPVLYQEKNGRRQPVEGRFSLLGKNTAGFTLGRYDHSEALVIDPVLAYSTYLGGAGSSGTGNGGNFGGAFGGQGTQIAVDKSGDAYIVGTTSVADFPVTAGAFQPGPNGKDYTSNDLYSFVVKLDPAGSALVYSTYFGGSGQPNQPGDVISSIFVDASGNAYLAGAARSDDFPVTAGAFQTISHGGGFPNGFVAKLNAAGSKLIYSTYIGGSGSDEVSDDYCTQVVADAAGNAYVTGNATSIDFPVTAGAFQTSHKGYATAFVAKFNATGTALVYSTFLGGSSSESGTSLAVDSAGDAYVAGVSASTDFPVTAHAYETINKAEVARDQSTGFVAKLNPAGSSVLYATFLGGSGGTGLTNASWADLPTSLVIDSVDHVYISGVTVSQDFPTTASAIQKTNKTYAKNSGAASHVNEFVTKMDPALSELLYSTYLGSSNGEVYPGEIRIADVSVNGTGAMAVDSSHNIYLTGTTTGWDFPVTKNALQPVNNTAQSSGSDNVAEANAFVAEIGSNGKLVYSTYLGGSGFVPGNQAPSNGDIGSSLALDMSGNVYVTGTAQSFDFPVTPGAYQISKTAQAAAFVAKLDMSASTGEATTTGLTSSTNPQVYTGKITFTALVESISGDGVPTGTVTFSGAGASQTATLDSGGQASITVSGLTQGSYTVTAKYSGSKTHLASSGKMTEVIAGKPATITLISGSGQTTTAGVPALNPIVVVVKDSKGVPVPGVETSIGSINSIEIGWTDGITDFNGRAEFGIYSFSTGLIDGDVRFSGVVTPAYFTLKVLSQVATPQIDFPFIFSSSQAITMSDATPGATIYYTTNGLPPTTSSTKYTGPITVTQTTTFKAIAALSGYGTSDMTYGSYVIPAAPVLSLATGVYSAAQTIAITDATLGAAIYYTTNGEPAGLQFGTKYTGPFTVSSTSKVQAVAIANYVPSAVVEAIIAIGPYTRGYADGIINTVGGVPGHWGNTGDNGPFSKAWLNDPGYVFFDTANNLYVVEYWNHDVRKVSAAGQTIALLAGNGTAGYSGDGHKATAAELRNPGGGAVDSEGNVYIADTGNNVIRKVTASTGDIATVAGDGKAGYAGDGKAATLAELNGPSAVAVDSAGDLYIADTGNNLIREVNAKTGAISTFAGKPGQWGWGGDGGLATGAKLLYPLAVAFDASGDLYISDSGNSAVRRVDAKTGKISTVAGDCSSSAGACTSGYSGDGGAAVGAKLDFPHELALDKAGNLYIADTFNNLVRQVNAKTGLITTAAGNGKGTGATTWDSGGYGGDGGAAILATLDNPTGAAIDASGNLYIGDDQNNLVREVVSATAP
jgi:sugar lactone lactonase YvrE